MNYYDYNNYDEQIDSTCQECEMALSSAGNCRSQICFEVDLM